MSMLMVMRQPELRLVGLRTGTTHSSFSTTRTEPISLTVIDDPSSPTAALVLTVEEFEVPLGESIPYTLRLRSTTNFD